MKFLKNIMDAVGRKFTFSDEVQTDSAKVASLHKHYSSHPSIGLTPARAAQILKEAELGDLVAQCELAEDIEEKDTHVLSELGKRRRAVQSLPWKITPPVNPTREEQRDADMCQEVLSDMTWFNGSLFDATDAIMKGFSCQEFTGWEDVDGLLLPKGLEWRDPAWFQTAPNDRNELRLRDGSAEGIELQPFGWVRHVARSKTGYFARVGLVRTLVWPYIFKNYSVRDLAEFLEIYGIPIRIGRYPAGASEKEKLSLLRAVMSVGHNAGGVIPRGMDIEIKSATDGAADPFMAFINWAERSASKAILGGTLTSQTDDGSGAYALGEVHERVAGDICISDALQLAPTITRDIVHPIVALNGQSFKSLRRLPRFEFDMTAPEDLTAYSVALPALVNIGMKIPSQWAHDKLQIPIADENEAVLTPQVPASPAFLSAQLPQGFAALSAQPAAKQDALASLSDAVTGSDWQNAIDPILKPVIDALETGGYAAAQTVAADLYSEMDDSELADILARAMFVADMWGRINATGR